MEEILIPALIVMLTAIAVILLGFTIQIRFPWLISRFLLRDSAGQKKFPVSCSTQHDQLAEPSAPPDMRKFNCRAQLTKQEEGNCVVDAFNVQIGGTIHTPCDMYYTTLQITIADVTDEGCNARPVHSRVKQWHSDDSPVFCYTADLGKTPTKLTTLSDWTSVAQLHLDWLMFPQKGNRKLLFSTSILSRKSTEELACAAFTFCYENPEFGYIDLQENIQRTKTLAVALAFAVSAVDGKLYDCEIELIKNWARNNVDISQASDKARNSLEKALNKTVAFFSAGNHLNIYDICTEIVEIVPIAQRYDILDLCLQVAQANGVASSEEINLLKNLADWLEVDPKRFRSMVEKTLPVDMHETKDQEVILGVSSDMGKEKTREQLNKEYIKWNSRVTSSDPAIQNQADQMLKLIAEARRQYVG
jgi:tellurite resistance protein